MRMGMARNPTRGPVAGAQVSPLRKSRQGSPRWSSPRTSPGLLAGHYAGCKFSEPPSPSTLPLPPQHWTPQRKAELTCGLLEAADRDDSTTTSHQLKMLLKIQA